MAPADHRITSREVAVAAGVCRQTVSRILNGTAPELVTARTRARVLRLAAEMGYVPNAAARQLRTQRSYCLGLALPFPAHYVMGAYSFTEALRGMTEVTDAEGYSLLICPPSKRGSAMQMLQDGRVDGIIAVHTPDEDELTALTETARPVVLMNRTGNERAVSWVDVDNYGGTRQALLHLLGNGRRLIAFVSGWPNLVISAVRLQAYRDTVGPQEDLVCWTTDPPTPEGGAEAMRRVLAGPRRPDAVLCCPDQLALGIMQVAAEAGLSVPQDLAIIGTGDTPISALLRPPLTTVRAPHFEKGRAAARLLIDLIEGKKAGAQSVLLGSELVVRGST
ncbi:MAG: LacI family DNA-binding transcriptional regulator [Chloroflexota bacterium]